MSPLFIQIFAETIFLPVKTVSTISKAIQRVETNIFVKWLLTLTSFPRGYTANISSCVYYLVFTLRHIHTLLLYVLIFKMSIDCVRILRLSVFFLIKTSFSFVHFDEPLIISLSVPLFSNFFNIFVMYFIIYRNLSKNSAPIPFSLIF